MTVRTQWSAHLEFLDLSENADCHFLKTRCESTGLRVLIERTGPSRGDPLH